MTTDLAPIELTYAGTDLQLADLSLFLEITSGLAEGVEVRGVDVIVPAASGRVVRPRKFDYRRVVLTGHVMGAGTDQASRRTSFRTICKILGDLFDPARDPEDLRVVLEDGDIARLSCRPLPGLMLAEVIPSEFATVSVELEAVSDWEGLGS